MKKTFRREKCAPKPRGTRSLNFTCYSEKDLFDLKGAWDRQHNFDKIKATDARGVHAELKQKYNTCDRESCWQPDKTIVDRVFAPKMPKTWKRNINEWLSSNDSLKVMTQFEKSFPEFEFLGPSPTDYFVKEYGNTCVWPELCKFNLKNWIDRGKTQIGVIFNLDPHYESGSHWVALYINTVSRNIYYFDSTGDRIHKHISKFRKEVQSQALHQLNQKYTFDSNYNVEHQYKNTECGMYVLFFIITMLLHDKDYPSDKEPVRIGKNLKAQIGGSYTFFSRVFKNNQLKFPDKLMENLRHEYFNE